MNIPFITSIRQKSDGEIMRSVMKGKEKAFDELYRRYARRMQGFFYRMLGGDAETAADFTQELFMRTWTSRKQFNGGENVSTWLFTMAYNLCRNEYRHREVEETYLWQQSTQEEAIDYQIEVALDTQAFDAALKKILQQMPTEPRMLFALRYEEDLSLNDIAEIMHLPLGTVKSRCHYLTLQIRQKLHHYEHLR